MRPTIPTKKNSSAKAPQVRWMLALGSLSVAAAACGSTVTPTASSATTPTTTRSGTAPAHHAGAHHRGNGVLLGVITALPSSAVDLKVHGKAETVLLAQATLYRQGKTTIAASALKTGERVRVVLTPGTASPTATTVVVLPAATTHSGTVSALSGTGFMLTSPSGKATPVATTSATTYRDGTSAAAASALQNGETVHVLGKTGSTGSIAATRVIIKATG